MHVDADWNCPLLKTAESRSAEITWSFFLLLVSFWPFWPEQKVSDMSDFFFPNIMSSRLNKTCCTNLLTLFSTQEKIGMSMWRGTSTPHLAQMWPYSVHLSVCWISKLAMFQSSGRIPSRRTFFMPMIHMCWRCTEGKQSSLERKSTGTAASWSKTSGRRNITSTWEST